MTLRDDLLPVVDAVRAIAGSSQLDQRVTQLTTRLRTWTNGRLGDGFSSNLDVVLPQRFTIKAVDAGTAQRVFGSGGTYRPGQIFQVIITPPYPGCGWLMTDLIPGDQPPGTEVLYMLSSNGRPSGVDGTFDRVGEFTHRPYRITLFLERSNSGPDNPAPPLTGNVQINTSTGNVQTNSTSGNVQRS